MTPDTLELDLIADLQANVTETIRHQQGGSEVEASKLAERIIDNLRRTYGGEAIYIPRFLSLKERVDRNRQIISLFIAGKSLAALASQFKLSRIQVWRIVSKK